MNKNRLWNIIEETIDSENLNNYSKKIFDNFNLIYNSIYNNYPNISPSQLNKEILKEVYINIKKIKSQLNTHKSKAYKNDDIKKERMNDLNSKLESRKQLYNVKIDKPDINFSENINHLNPIKDMNKLLKKQENLRGNEILYQKNPLDDKKTIAWINGETGDGPMYTLHNKGRNYKNIKIEDDVNFNPKLEIKEIEETDEKSENINELSFLSKLKTKPKIKSVKSISFKNSEIDDEANKVLLSRNYDIPNDTKKQNEESVKVLSERKNEILEENNEIVEKHKITTINTIEFNKDYVFELLKNTNNSLSKKELFKYIVEESHKNNITPKYSEIINFIYDFKIINKIKTIDDIFEEINKNPE